MGRVLLGGEGGAVDGGQAFCFLAEAGNAVEKGAGVGVLGRTENFFNGALLDEFSFEHNQNSIGKIGDDAEVVGDEKDGHTELIA